MSGHILNFVEKIAITTDELSQGMNEIVWAVNPQYDSLQSLLAYLRRYISEYADMAGLKTKISWPTNVPNIPISSSARHHCFMVVKEALHNVVQHAKAKQLTTEAFIRDRQITIMLEDNGCGFLMDEQIQHRTGNGLRNMKKRLGELNGNFFIHSEIGKGTSIKIILPLEY